MKLTPSEAVSFGRGTWGPWIALASSPPWECSFVQWGECVQNYNEKWGFAILLRPWREYPKLLSVKLEKVPHPLEFTKPSCECSLFIVEVEKICKETVAVNTRVFLGTLSEGVCVCYSRKNIFHLGRKYWRGMLNTRHYSYLCIYVFTHV